MRWLRILLLMLLLRQALGRDLLNGRRAASSTTNGVLQGGLGEA
jgi:hypothetical protein